MAVRGRLLCVWACLPLALGGCARTSDGTVIIPRQVDVRRVWDKGPSAPRTPPVESGAMVFPVAPLHHGTQSAKARVPARRGKAASRRSLGETPASEAAKPLTCGQARDIHGRVQVVCQ